MIPQDAPHEDAQPAKEATRDTETPAGAEGGRDDLRALRDRIASAIAADFDPRGEGS